MPISRNIELSGLAFNSLNHSVICGLKVWRIDNLDRLALGLKIVDVILIQFL